MKLKNLIKNTTCREVRQSLLKAYTDTNKSIDGYESVFKELLELSPKKILNNKNMRIVLKKVHEKLDDPTMGTENYIDVCGKDGSIVNDHLPKGMKRKKDKFGYSEQKFALELIPWEEWLNMKIDNQTLSEYSANDIIAHCIWEMTFFGFDQATIKAQKEEIDRRVKELDNMSEEEKNEKLIPMEEMEKRIKAWQKRLKATKKCK